MGGKHRYEPDVHRTTWVPAAEDSDPSRVEHLNTGLNEVVPPVRQSWWERLRGTSKP